MKTKEELRDLLDSFQATAENKNITFDEEAILAAYSKNQNGQSLPIKILSVLGGILATAAFLGFLLVAGLYNSIEGQLIFGIIFTTAAIWVNKKYDAIILDTVSISSFLIGLILLAFSLSQLELNGSLICVIFILIALGSLTIAQNYLLSFISVLIINGSILALIVLNKAYELAQFYAAALALALTIFLLWEAKIITMNVRISKLYNPLKTGLSFSFLSGLILLGVRTILPISPDYLWITSGIIILAIVYVVFNLLRAFDIGEDWHKITACILVVITLLPTVLSPAISGSILFMILSFRVNYKLGLVLGIISSIYFIAQYYYDLRFTLLTKSILLFSAGIFFAILYLVIYKKLIINEKI
ncbi:MAG: DUF4401 domain-containing protein [Bacteroidia bacterium]|nr:DUF4401 domain-containing protein [Bacteroidia bacterium]